MQDPLVDDQVADEPPPNPRFADAGGPKTAFFRSLLKLDKASAHCCYAKSVAQFALDQHQEHGGLTLVVLNQVRRAQDVFDALGRLGSSAKAGLLHSRFRPADRRAEKLLYEPGDRIVVTTQVVEAGVDLSARTLISELAPWPSLIQRFGRCNRHGEMADGAEVWWIDADEQQSALVLPYVADDLIAARERLSSTQDVGPQRLEAIGASDSPVVRPILRRRDLMALFDTSPDISGEELDVSRFVRDGNDLDVFVYWEAAEATEHATDRRPRPSRESLCRVGVGAFREFFEHLVKKQERLHGVQAKKHRPLTWSPLQRRWVVLTLDAIRPGCVVRLDPEVGGYTPSHGWLPDSTAAVPPINDETAATGLHDDDVHDGDTDSETGRWVRLDHHLAHVRDEAQQLAAQLALPTEVQEILATAGLWHDVGKAHAEFQGRLLDPTDDHPDLRPPSAGGGLPLWAKSAHQLRSAREPHRRHFRHELASMLAWLARGCWHNDRERDLVAYVVLAHHGKVRVSLRSLPDERPPAALGDAAIAHGLIEGDRIARVDIPGVGLVEDVPLALDLMRLGQHEHGPSWLARVLALRDAPDLGPFRLALLETVVRVADWTASRREQQGDYADD